MKQKEPIDELRALVDTGRIGILSTVGTDGYPHLRWMTAATLQGEKNYIYCVTASGSKKVADLQKNDKVAWSFQSVTLDRIVKVSGRARVIEIPELKAQVLEALGRNLDIFWRINPDPKHLVVLETAIESLSLFHPADSSVTDVEASR